MKSMSTHQPSQTQAYLKSAIVIAIYIVLTLMVAPFAFGPIQFRISEILNYLGLYNRRYIYAVTLAVFISNFYQYGPVDMVVGSLTTLFSMWVGIWLGDRIVKARKGQSTWLSDDLLRHLVLALAFALCIFPIAMMLVAVGAEAIFLPAYISLAISELIVMLIGIPIMMTLRKRVDFTR
ncbi:TPA: QueT transporter family protein [Streptococcus suis]